MLNLNCVKSSPGFLLLTVQNSINSIKHFLKFNIKKDDNDSLRMLINKGNQPAPSKDLHGKLQQVFKFLQW